MGKQALDRESALTAADRDGGGLRRPPRFILDMDHRYFNHGRSNTDRSPAARSASTAAAGSDLGIFT
jgi:hypothetical protein